MKIMDFLLKVDCSKDVCVFLFEDELFIKKLITCFSNYSTVCTKNFIDGEDDIRDPIITALSTYMYNKNSLILLYVKNNDFYIIDHYLKGIEYHNFSDGIPKAIFFIKSGKEDAKIRNLYHDNNEIIFLEDLRSYDRKSINSLIKIFFPDVSTKIINCFLELYEENALSKDYNTIVSRIRYINAVASDGQEIDTSLASKLIKEFYKEENNILLIKNSLTDFLRYPSNTTSNVLIETLDYLSSSKFINNIASLFIRAANSIIIKESALKKNQMLEKKIYYLSEYSLCL